MYEIPPSPQRSAIMRAVRSKDTAPELVVRRLLFSLGYRYRVHERGLPGAPDLVFKGRHKVIFVHGCFWHQHPGCRDGHIPASNKAFWERKFARNCKRDMAAIAALKRAGWGHLVVWECETKDLSALQERLLDFLGA